MTSATDDWEAARYADRRLRSRLSPFSPGRGSIAGVVLALIITVGFWAVGRLWPGETQPELTDGTAIVLADGRFYVMEGEKLHPTPNLASALLASARVEQLAELNLDRYAIGEPRGIAGAISALPDPDALLPAHWQLCAGEETAQTLTIGAAPYLPPPAGERTLLTDGTALWLVSGGMRTPMGVGAAGANPAAAVLTSTTIVNLLAEAHLPLPLEAPSTVTPTSAIVCAQSDPAAPFAQPSLAAAARTQQSDAPANSGTRVVMPAGAGLLIRQADGKGYWLLSYTAELAPIADDAALARLGYTPQQAVQVPEPLIKLLAPGPELSVEAARAGVG